MYPDKACYGILRLFYVPLSQGFQHLLPREEMLHLIIRNDMCCCLQRPHHNFNSVGQNSLEFTTEQLEIFFFFRKSPFFFLEK